MPPSRPEIRQHIARVMNTHLLAAIRESNLREIPLGQTSSMMVMIWALEELIVNDGDAEAAGLSHGG